MSCMSSDAECMCDRKLRIKCSCLPCQIFNLYFHIFSLGWHTDELSTFVAEGTERAYTTLKSLRKHLWFFYVSFRWWAHSDVSASSGIVSLVSTMLQPDSFLCYAPSMKAEPEVSNELPAQSRRSSFVCLWQCKKECRGSQALSQFFLFSLDLGIKSFWLCC